MPSLDQFLTRAETVLSRLENLLPPVVETVNWDVPSVAYRWRRRSGRGMLQPITHSTRISLPDLYFIERQKGLLEQNTRQFIEGKPANNVLLTGARGTGKSSLIRACLSRFAGDGLRLIEVDRNDLVDLADIGELIALRPERFILYCDDLSFEEGDSSYKALKTALDGSVAAQPDNMLIYATSNRRHLLPERMSDNAGYVQGRDGDMHPGETVEEKISFSDRFGLWLSFYPFNQDEYLTIVAHWLRSFGCSDRQVENARGEALQWGLHRGSRSGRTAWQFARDFAGRHL
ncbi:MAG: ATP-binding protein [Betaproteobacteria bacterium]|nr:ATP-binding protein [Betaproteobacteria bacterium]